MALIRASAKQQNAVIFVGQWYKASNWDDSGKVKIISVSAKTERILRLLHKISLA